ncbi:hypothetical protein JW859_13115 [bacterium]|nr:hypothetical protein [bacterium]
MRVVLAILLALTVLCGVAWAAETPADNAPQLTGVEIFPLADLQMGMKATAYTVIRGTKVESFNVEVLEVIPDGGFDGGPMILARFTGPVVDFSDGIAGGYSGSPVYINGKLVGAVSMAMPFTDTHIGGITPIEQMLKSLPDGEEIDYSDNTVLPETENSGIPVDADGKVISYVHDYEAARQFNDAMAAAGIERFAAVPATTPVYFSGISPAVMELYRDKLQALLGDRFTLMEMPVGRADDEGLFLREDANKPGLFLHQTSNEPPLKGGDACAVSFVEGDIELAGIGTVTYADTDGRFLIFGHMMMGEGDTNFPIGLAYITWVHSSIQRAFKQGVRLNTLGTITKDHAAGCGGSFDIEPDMIPVRFKINDIDLGTTESMRFRVVRHRDYTPILLSMALSQAATELMDRRPGGTLKLSYHIEGVGLKEPMRRTNYFFDDSNVIMNGAFELMPIADLLTNNVYRDVEISKIEVLAEVTRNRINASIDEAELLPDKTDAEDESEESAEEQIEEAGEDANIIEKIKTKILEQEIQPEEEVQPEEVQPEDSESTIGRRMPVAPSAEQAPWLNRLRTQARPRPQSRAYRPDYRLQQNPNPQEEPEVIVPTDGAPVEYITDEIPTYHPGETIRVKVRLQPFRADTIWREFSIQVPEDFPSGSTMVYIHGGGDLMSWSELGGKGRSLWGFGPIIDTTDFDLDKIIEQIVDAPLNNELLVTLQRPYEYIDPTVIELDENGEQVNSDEEEPEPFVDEKYQMEWVIYNSYALPVNILTAEDEAELEEIAEEESADAADGEDADDAESEYEAKWPF